MPPRNVSDSSPASRAGACCRPATSSKIRLNILNPEFIPDAEKVLQNATTYWANKLGADLSLAESILSDAEYRAAQLSAKVARMQYGNAVERLV